MKKLGKYEVLERIGAGGYGVVFKGYDPFIKRTVAIKTCNSDDERVRLRFYREAEIAGNLIHPNITTVYDFGIQDDLPYLVEEFLTGEDLDHKIKRQADLSLAQRLDYLVQVARGLEYAHAQGVVHRDIKPGNIRVLDNDRAKIMDFGTAKLANVESGLTQAGMTLGTAAYISPEQIQGSDVAFSADVFSFGITAYELLTYVRPFDGRKIATVLHQILNEEPRPVTAAWPDCPPELAQFLARCLEKDPSRRYPRAGDLLADLQGVIQQYTRNRRAAVELARTIQLPAEIPPPRTPSGQVQTTGKAPVPVVSSADLLPPPPPAEAERPASVSGSTPVEALVQRARNLHESRDLDRALLAASAAAEAAPGDADVHQLVHTVEQDLEAELARERQRAALASRLQEAAGLLERLELTAAQRALDALEQAAPTAPSELLSLRFQLEEARRRQRADRSAKALERAERQLDRAQYQAAHATLSSALAEDPENHELHQALAAAERLRDRQAQPAGAARADAVASIEALIARGKLEEAEQALAFARQMLGEIPELERLAPAIRDRRVQLLLRRQLADKVATAGEHAEQGNYPSALALLLDVEQEDPEYPGLRALISATRQALVARDEARRRLQATADATATIEGMLRRMELDRAEEALAFAEQQLAPFAPGSRLRALLVEARGQLARTPAEAPPPSGPTETGPVIHARLRRAQQLLTGGEFGAAIRLLRQTLEEHPESEEVEVMLAAAKEAQAKAAESDRREQAIAEATQSVDVHLAANDLEAARQAVEFAIELLGPASELLTLRKRVTQAELSETAVRSRVTRVDAILPAPPQPPPRPPAPTAGNELDALLAIAAELARVGQIAAARRTVQAALDLDPEHTGARELLARLESS
jgi:serine/threonine protein kinase/Tfp pilus assembly protein PilF